METRVVSYYTANHGSSTGELKSWTQYYNPVRSEWSNSKEEVMIDLKCEKYRNKLKKTWKKTK